MELTISGRVVAAVARSVALASGDPESGFRFVPVDEAEFVARRWCGAKTARSVFRDPGVIDVPIEEVVDDDVSDDVSDVDADTESPTEVDSRSEHASSSLDADECGCGDAAASSDSRSVVCRGDEQPDDELTADEPRIRRSSQNETKRKRVDKSRPESDTGVGSMLWSHRR